MTIAEWPVVNRRRLVHAYKPGETSTSEGPFRTLRGHKWASSGVRVTRRAGRRMAGQMTLFSSLNVESARLARLGNPDEAARVACAAEELEAGPEFAKLRHIMSYLSGYDAQQVVDGVLPEGAPAELAEALKAVARRTEQWGPRGVGGPATMVPRWMAVAAQRDKVGSLLALVMDKLDDGRAVVEAVPAIDVPENAGTGRFSPFGRGDPRILSLTQADELLLAGEPQPLRILVPVLIEE